MVLAYGKSSSSLASAYYTIRSREHYVGRTAVMVVDRIGRNMKKKLGTCYILTLILTSLSVLILLFLSLLFEQKTCMFSMGYIGGASS